MFSIAVGMPGPFELIIILAIILILFGPGKLPKVLAQMGKGMKAFKEGLSGNGPDSDDAVDITPEEAPPKAIDEVDEVPESPPAQETEEAEEVVADDEAKQA